MTIETTLIIMGFCIFACFLVFEWQKAAVPPYQEPLEDKPVVQESLPIDGWNTKIGEQILYKEAAPELEPTPLNPKAAWPFPHGPKP